MHKRSPPHHRMSFGSRNKLEPFYSLDCCASNNRLRWLIGHPKHLWLIRTDLQQAVRTTNLNARQTGNHPKTKQDQPIVTKTKQEPCIDRILLQSPHVFMEVTQQPQQDSLEQFEMCDDMCGCLSRRVRNGRERGSPTNWSFLPRRWHFEERGQSIYSSL